MCSSVCVCSLSSCERVCEGVCVPRICVLNEFDKFLEVVRSSDDDGLRGVDGSNRLDFGLHHSFYKTDPIKLQTIRGGNIYSEHDLYSKIEEEEIYC